MQSTVKSEIIEAEQRLQMAMVSSDVDALGKLLSPSLIFINHMGQVISKSDDLDAHRKGDLKINSLSLTDQIIKLSGEVAIVSVHTKISGSYKGSPASGNFRFTRVWEKANGAWQISQGREPSLASSRQTRLNLS